MPTIRLPEILTARQRAWIHAAAGKASIPHQSTTTAAGDRVLLVGDDATAATPHNLVDITLPDTSNDSVRAAVAAHFPQLDACLIQEQVGMGLGGSRESVQETVQRFEELLAMERQAEILEVQYRGGVRG